MYCIERKVNIPLKTVARKKAIKAKAPPPFDIKAMEKIFAIIQTVYKR